jgi:serine/threonine protein kinase
VDWIRWQDVPHWQIDRVEFALANPPIETEPPVGPERALTIGRTLTRPSRGGVNVVTCFLDGNRSVEYVAKIYDGVDYLLSAWDDGSDAGKGGYFDCMTSADRDYSIEAWAYRIMQPVIGNTGIVPTYHGSWTFALQTSQPGRQRWVRMILIELIQGECMLDLVSRAETEPGNGKMDYSLLPPEGFRLRVLQNILEAEHTIWRKAAVLHNDIVPRNVMVKPNGSIVIIDFNQATIYDFVVYDMQHPKDTDPDSLPLSPIEWHWPMPNRFNKWARWVPEKWLENKELGAEWLISTYRDSPRFDRPTPSFLDHPVHARRSKRVQKLLEELGRKPT